MKIHIITFLAATSLFIMSCEQGAKKESTSQVVDSTKTDSSKAETMNVDTAGVIKKDNLRLTPLNGSTEFQDAALQLNSPEQDAKLASGEVTFKYDVKNYKLKNQTPHANCNECNNSKDGQHIHLILNNEPYIAIYTPEFKDTLKEGHYVALSFLSRSYHESIKQFQAFDLRQFTVGKSKSKPVDLTQPLLFYSRPKGEYVGEFAKKILLDFYLVNTDLKADGNKVKATINGVEFILDKWQPYVIEGLPMGENKVKIELIDKEGKTINGPLNTIERKFTLKEKAV